MTGIDWLSVVFAGVGVLMLILSPMAKPTGGYRQPLDPFGPAPVFEREFSQHEARYNRDPRSAMVKGALAFMAVAVMLQLFKIL